MSGVISRHVYETLSRLPSCRNYWLAYSGGRDSHVLLHVLAAIRQELWPAQIKVVHIDHGLHPDAGQWAAHCQSVCDALDLPLLIRQVNARPAAGESPEAAARKARYAELAELIGAGDILLAAHHQDDQAETLMLQLLRGAGPHGLAAMPELKKFSSGYLARPLLGFARTDLDEYAGCQGLQWIDDPSNEDHGFKRNYLRHEVMPLLQKQWPSFQKTLSRTAALCADAAAMLDQLAAEDLLALEFDEVLSVTGLLALDPVRQRNVLRNWCASKGLPLPGRAHIRQIQQQMLSADANMPLVSWPGVELRRYQDCLYIMVPLVPLDPLLELVWDMGQALVLPHGRLSVASGREGDLAFDSGRQQAVVRLRRGGERILTYSGQHRSVKKILQEQRIAPWLRGRIPLLYIDGELAAIAGVMICDHFVARTGQVSIRLNWQPN